MQIQTSVFTEVRQRLLVCEYYVLVLRDDLPPQVLPAGRQLPQLLQLTNPADGKVAERELKRK